MYLFRFNSGKTSLASEISHQAASSPKRVDTRADLDGRKAFPESARLNTLSSAGRRAQGDYTRP